MSINSIIQRRRRIYGRLLRGKKAPQSGPGRWKFWLSLMAGLIFFGLVAVVGIGLIISGDLPDPNKLAERAVPESTKIYDRSGEHLLYEAYQQQKRTLVALDEINPWLVQATIAIEDKLFYQHSGVRLPSIIRAQINNLLGRRAGGGGASTITQQLIKNAVVGNERSYWRKLKEAWLALRLERAYSKDQILQMYLNEIPYGSTNYGVEAAAQSYFHISAKNVTLAQAATIAALTRAPSHYLANPAVLRERRDLVLSLMQSQGYISAEEMHTAQNQALRIYHGQNLTVAPHFVIKILAQLSDKFGEQMVNTGGLKVITTLDYDKQLAAERIIAAQGDKFAQDANANNAALVALDPATGQVLALVGSRDYNNDDIDGQFNVAIDGKQRQPGSSLKPFIYTFAFERGYTPDTVVYDVLTNFDRRVGGDYTPRNYDGKEHGLVTFRSALQGSLNIPSVKVLHLLGVPETVDFLRRFGYSTLEGDGSKYGLSLVLGSAGVTLLEHTNAYATLANGGAYRPASSLLKVINPLGDVLYDWQAPEGREAVKSELAGLITSVLTDDDARAFIFGRRGNLTLPDRPVAAKTGTTNDNKDAWTLGYTPTLAAGVWVGNTIPAPMKFGGNKLAGVIWNQFMRAALASTTPQDFSPPPLPDQDLKPQLRGSDGGLKLPINTVTGRIANSSTSAGIVSERVFLPPHDLLHYVRRDNPRGPVPDNPADDPQYDNWESALNDWVLREQAAGRELALSEPPTLYDGVSDPALAPRVEISAPLNGATVETRELMTRVLATAPRGVVAVNFLVDGILRGTATAWPFSVTLNLPDELPGIHELKAVASDDQGNSGHAIVTFALTASPVRSAVRWADSSPLALSLADWPRVMPLRIYKWEDADKLEIFLKSATSSERLIYTFITPTDRPDNNLLQFTWRRLPAPGVYRLRASLIVGGKQFDEQMLSVMVATSTPVRD